MTLTPEQEERLFRELGQIQQAIQVLARQDRDTSRDLENLRSDITALQKREQKFTGYALGAMAVISVLSSTLIAYFN